MATTNGVKPVPMADGAPPKFALPVDSEYKAKAMNLFSLSRPHMLSFHLNWVAFFITFLAAFASAPLVPIIRDSINLEQHEANIAGTANPALPVGITNRAEHGCKPSSSIHGLSSAVCAPFFVMYIQLNISMFVVTSCTPRLVRWSNKTRGQPRVKFSRFYANSREH